MLDLSYRTTLLERSRMLVTTEKKRDRNGSTSCLFVQT